MPIIKLIEIKNFRGIRELQWAPTPGINCLVGPGDSGKSTILTAIDFCLTARRHLQFSDSDFFNADVNQEIFIQVTIGNLTDALQPRKLSWTCPSVLFSACPARRDDAA